MKRYVVFIGSFLVLYVVAQLLSGLILTALYPPDLSFVNGHVRSEVEFGQFSMLSLLLTIVVATLAYFSLKKYLPQMINNVSSKINRFTTNIPTKVGKVGTTFVKQIMYKIHVIDGCGSEHALMDFL